MIPVVFVPSILEDDDDDMSKYTLQASFDGRLKSGEGFLSAAGDLTTLTSASGKDLYLTAAKVTFFSNNNNNTTAVTEIVLKLNGVIIETTKFGLGPVEKLAPYDFKNLGGKVAATQIIKLEVITIDSRADVEGFVQAIEVPTGENPTTYKGA